MYSFLRAVLYIRLWSAVLAALAATWWIVPDDSWFEGSLPDRTTVFLIAVGLAASVLVCTGLVRFGSARLPEAEREQLRNQPAFF